jgi:hypothetical protein
MPCPNDHRQPEAHQKEIRAAKFRSIIFCRTSGHGFSHAENALNEMRL